jgi:dihydroneopterin aldolase
MDCIRIINLKIPGRHGVYEFEKEKDGLFELDVELFSDLKSAGKSDDLAKTVNYGEAVEIITEVFNSKDRNLIESVAEDISRELLSKYTISKVIIRIRKPHAPISANFDTVEVELERAN